MRPDELPDLLGIPLSDEQLAAATAPLSPQLIVAGAGTGKTTVMAARVVWLIASDQVDTDQVLGLTFTNKAAAELRSRIRRAVALLDLPGDPGEATVMTYHAFAGHLLTELGSLLGVESDSRMLSDGQRARLAYRTACHPLEPLVTDGSPDRIAGLLSGMDDSLADLDVSPEDIRAHDTHLLDLLDRAEAPKGQVDRMRAAARERLRLVDLVVQFRESKRAGEFLDFSDQVRLAAELSRHSPGVAAAMRSRFRVVLLDEYQDTSRAQRRMLQGLFADGHPVTAVGDPCQAIYGWRGASVTNIDEFPRHFPDAAGRRAATYPLSVNRRSLPAILRCANAIAGDLHRIHDDVRPLRAAPGATGGLLTCALLPDQDSELIWLSDRLAAARERHDWQDMAVLCRSNDQVAAVVEQLGSVGIPAYVSSRRDLLALPEVEAVISWLRLTVSADANPDVLAQLMGPRWRIGPRDMSAVAARARELSGPDAPPCLLDAVHDLGPTDRYSSEAVDRLRQFVAELDRFARVRDRSVGDAVAAAVDLLAPGLVPVDAGSVPGSLHALIGLARGFTGLDGSRGLNDFMAYLADCRRFRASPQDPQLPAGEGVAVMTIHAAKGLEFPLVALPFLSDGVFPGARGAPRWVTSAEAVPPVAPDEPDPALHLGFPSEHFTGKDHDAYVAACREDDRHDEDRLAYVAVTRAENEVIASGHWWGPTQKTPRGASAYLRAVERVCREVGGTVDVWTDEPADRPQQSEAAAILTSWPTPVDRPDVIDLGRRVAEAPELAPDTPLARAAADLVAERTLSETTPEVPSVVSVSALTAWLKDADEAAAAQRRPMPRRPSRAAARGTAFHRWMEDRVGQQSLFDVDASDEAREFEEMLRGTAYADRTPHVVEQPFVIEVGGTAVTGRIDAVFRVTDDPAIEWEVVDWKTTAAHDAAQLAIYREAWARLAGCPPERVRATFVHLDDGSHVSFDDLVAAEHIVAQATRTS